MIQFPILSILVFLPFTVAVLISFLGTGPRSRNMMYIITLLTMVSTFGLSVWIYYNFKNINLNYQFIEKFYWFSSNINYHVGIDGISLLFILATTFMLPFCILAAWSQKELCTKSYLISFLMLETAMNGVFVSLNALLFYLFFEALLIPSFLIIGFRGDEKRIRAAFKFFLYTLFGSVLMLISLIFMYHLAGTLDLSALGAHPFYSPMSYFLWSSFFIAFAIKLPIWPFHTWLKPVQVATSTVGSMLVSGLLFLVGGIGFYRFCINIFSEVSHSLMPFILLICLIGMFYSFLSALAQSDMKKVMSYSLVANMSYIALGLFSDSELAVQGALFQMMSHGLIAFSIFFMLGILNEQVPIRDLSKIGGLGSIMPKYATVLMILILANIGLPGTSGFIGEFLILIGAYMHNSLFAVFATMSVFLSASYSLWFYRRLIFGMTVSSNLKNLRDLNLREKVITYSLVGTILFFGFYPSPLLDLISKPIHASFEHNTPIIIYKGQLSQSEKA